MRDRHTIVALLATLLLAACSPGPGATDSRPSSSTPVVGSSRSPAATLPARWWLWAESTGDRNPIADTTGADCAVNQPDDVWFLAGTFGGTAERSCRIPAGRPVYFPILNLICEVSDGVVSKRTLERCTPRPRTASARLDGDPLTMEVATSEGSFPFEAGPVSRIAAPGHFQAVAGGTWVGPLMVEPGRHILRFRARRAGFSLAVTYHLTVG